jgi:cytochrome b involved in lipid metabolism
VRLEQLCFENFATRVWGLPVFELIATSLLFRNMKPEFKFNIQIFKTVSMQEYTWEEVAKHRTANDAWTIVKGKVYDVTNYLSTHPGGESLLLRKCGMVLGDSDTLIT